jgi:hypothetical protein
VLPGISAPTSKLFLLYAGKSASAYISRPIPLPVCAAPLTTRSDATCSEGVCASLEAGLEFWLQHLVGLRRSSECGLSCVGPGALCLWLSLWQYLSDFRPVRAAIRQPEGGQAAFTIPLRAPFCRASLSTPTQSRLRRRSTGRRCHGPIMSWWSCSRTRITPACSVTSGRSWHSRGQDRQAKGDLW